MERHGECKDFTQEHCMWVVPFETKYNVSSPEACQDICQDNTTGLIESTKKGFN